MTRVMPGTTPSVRPSRPDRGLTILGMPALVWYLFFMIAPIIAMFGISFLRWPKIIAPSEVIGFDNYAALVQDPTFWAAAGNTAVQLIVVIPVMIPLAFMLAYYLQQSPRGHQFLSIVFFTPGLISLSVKAMMFFAILAPNGALNGFLSGIGADAATTAWLADPKTALACIIVIDLWNGIGYTAILMNARLAGVPREVYEAAALDGAGHWKMMWRIAYPITKDYVGTMVMLQFIWTLFNSAPVVLLLTQGGPGTASTTLSYFVYDLAFQSSQVGYSQAASVVLFLVGLVGMLVIRRTIRANY